VSSYVLVPGAGGAAWYWHRAVPELRRRGHAAVAVDLPAADESAGLAEYTDAIVAAIGDRADTIVVAQSLGGFSASLACDRVPVRRLILLNAMVPVPGETAGAWWGNTGQAEASRAYAVGLGLSPDMDIWDLFFHDVPDEVVEEARRQGEPVQADTIFGQPWPLAAWPEVPTRFLQGREDRLFPLEFQRRIVADRLGIPVHETEGGHLAALAHPVELVDRFEELSTNVE
jgi:pimeloyl-ACP methyl ester carboxylesterase